MPERTPYIAANWKMNKTVAEAAEFVDALLPRIAATQSDVVVCPPFTALPRWSSARAGPRSGSPPRTCTRTRPGAFTGEVSAPMLVELDVEAVVLGHSERRQLFGETDEALARKVAGGAGRRPRADPLRRRERGGARRRRDRGGAGAPAAGRPGRGRDRADLARGRRRLRADLGDRHRPHRHPRAGPGGVRLHPRRAARCAAPRPTRCGSSTAAR